MHFVQTLGIQPSCSCQNAKAKEVAQVAEVTLVWMVNIYALPFAYPSVNILRNYAITLNHSGGINWPLLNINYSSKWPFGLYFPIEHPSFQKSSIMGTYLVKNECTLSILIRATWNMLITWYDIQKLVFQALFGPGTSPQKIFHEVTVGPRMYVKIMK